MLGKRRNLLRENEVRRHETKKRRADKVVIGYVKALYPEIFEQASAYYVKLDQANPEKDLTKTVAFRTLQKNKVAVTDNFELKIKLIDNGKQTKTTATTQAVKTTPALEAEATASLTPQPTTDTMYETPLLPLDEETLELPLDEETLATMIAVEAEATASPPALEAEATTDTMYETPLLPLDEETLELPLDEETLATMIADLRQDPFMLDFLDNIEFELDDCPLW